MVYDVVIVGGGPSGLSAALTLGRARRRVLLCDSGARRNAGAEAIYNFVTRDGTAPDEFRLIARRQLGRYPNVEVRDVRVASISGVQGAFRVGLMEGSVEARRILLCTGVVDEMVPIDGFGELWGHAIFQCPYCHGWELQDRRWGYLVLDDSSQVLPFALQALGWAREVVVFTGSGSDVSNEVAERLVAAGVRLETAPVARLVARERRLEAVALADGSEVPCEVLFAHPRQRQVELIRALGVALDDEGYVRTSATTHETSIAGIHASGDLTTHAQGALYAASCGAQAAMTINIELALER
jgi:thioredoxin reductase